VSDPVQPDSDAESASTPDALDEHGRASEAPRVGPGSASPAAARRPGAFEAFEQIQPILAVVVMVITFMLLAQPFAVALIALVWVVATRLSRTRRFLGFTLTEALAWSATLVIVFLVLAIGLFMLGATGQ
jgi:hypothetical protein